MQHHSNNSKDDRGRGSDRSLDALVDSIVTDLTNARKQIGLTALQVAQKAGIPEAHVLMIESSDARYVPFESLTRYAGAVGISLTLVSN